MLWRAYLLSQVRNHPHHFSYWVVLHSNYTSCHRAYSSGNLINRQYLLLTSNFISTSVIKIRQIRLSTTRKRGQGIDTISLRQTLILLFLTLHKTTNHFPCEVKTIHKTSRQRITAKRSTSHLQSSASTSVRSKKRSSLRVVIQGQLFSCCC